MVSAAIPERNLAFPPTSDDRTIFCGLACHQQRIVIEVDGSQHLDRLQTDNVRTAFLNSRGYRVLRFWNNEVLQQIDAVMAAIYAAVYENPESAPHP
ncbi:MAG TPA: DUF559 domain-containing protein [Xanthobacteraceae bacterium]|nr:DUF559 domain-containing protein [Xanthobacteraceae bacterium]